MSSNKGNKITKRHVEKEDAKDRVKDRVKDNVRDGAKDSAKERPLVPIDDAMNGLMKLDAFPDRKLQNNKKMDKNEKLREEIIDESVDSDKEIIHKLVHNLRVLRNDFEKFKIHAEGSFATSVELNRMGDDLSRLFDK